MERRFLQSHERIFSFCSIKPIVVDVHRVGADIIKVA